MMNNISEDLKTFILWCIKQGAHHIKVGDVEIRVHPTMPEPAKKDPVQKEKEAHRLRYWSA